MLKNILKLEGAQKLTRKEQKEVKGSFILPNYCGPGCREAGMYGACYC
jgi:hypothetical protein